MRLYKLATHKQRLILKAPCCASRRSALRCSPSASQTPGLASSLHFGSQKQQTDKVCVAALLLFPALCARLSVLGQSAMHRNINKTSTKHQQNINNINNNDINNTSRTRINKTSTKHQQHINKTSTTPTKHQQNHQNLNNTYKHRHRITSTENAET